ncbi:3-isopropylmalate dehydrogenase [Bacillus subtilis]|nr:3-isopropylmalate dehydrogenase [Bacillus subtilis]RPK22595.1 3-isopropylmalate dehydrogenase [Bacillus subtilis]
MGRRHYFDLYANIRPAKTLLSISGKADLVILRESVLYILCRSDCETDVDAGSYESGGFFSNIFKMLKR